MGVANITGDKNGLAFTKGVTTDADVSMRTDKSRSREQSGVICAVPNLLGSGIWLVQSILHDLQSRRAVCDSCIDIFLDVVEVGGESLDFLGDVGQDTGDLGLLLLRGLDLRLDGHGNAMLLLQQLVQESWHFLSQRLDTGRNGVELSVQSLHVLDELAVERLGETAAVRSGERGRSEVFAHRGEHVVHELGENLPQDALLLFRPAVFLDVLLAHSLERLLVLGGDIATLDGDQGLDHRGFGLGVGLRPL